MQSATQLIDLIREGYQQRQAATRVINAINSATLAFIRTMLGWRWDSPEANRAKIKAMAVKIKANIERGHPDADAHPAIASSVTPLVMIAAESTRPYKEHRKKHEKDLAALVQALPAYDWWVGLDGCNAIGLATIIGEAGDLSNYANPGKLWRRFGLAPFNNGSGTYRAGSTWKRAPTWTGGESLSAKQWSEFGYVGRRRAAAYKIAQSIVLAKGSYYPIYTQRKAYELHRAPEMRPAQADKRAHRYMAKQLFRDLWNEWTGNEVPVAE